MQNIFTKLQSDYSSFHGVFHWLGDTAIRMAGDGGCRPRRNPTGFISDFFTGYRPMVRQVRSVLLVGCAVEVGLWVLALQHSIDNWTFALLTIAIAVLLPRIAAKVNPAAYAGNTVIKVRERESRETPLELVGFGQPFEPADLLMLDAAMPSVSTRRGTR